ncbi:MAG: hypothetical protein Q7U40_06420 [Desulfatirhabdiaceae bacterium]|nr:hypothetical protein [Desulfatirhabdiaceae bacterium]
MGKGEIISGGDGGLYQVRLNYYRVTLEERLDVLDLKIIEQEERIVELLIAEPVDLDELGRARLQLAALEHEKELYESLPENPEISAWCSDLTEDLTGEVGTIELGGQLETGKVLIRPGYDGRADFDAGRDGQLMHVMAMSPAQAMYNFIMMTGWQKWMPTYRAGEITAIDDDTCSVSIDTVLSCHQGLDVTGETELTDVPIEYMNCNGAAFEAGDRVIVEYRNRSAENEETPYVIGFESEPKPCECYIRIKINGITPTKIKTVYLVEQESGKVHTASSRAPSSPPSPLYAYDVCGPFTGVVFPAKLYLSKTGGGGDVMFEFWSECTDGTLDHIHFGSSIYPYEYPFGSYLYGGIRGHEAIPHSREIIAKKIERAQYATPLTAVPTLNTVHNFANMKVLMIALYQKLDQDGCGDLIPVTDKKYYPQVWQGFYPQVPGGAYPPNAGCLNWGVWHQCESGYFGEEFGDPIYDDFAAQYTAGALVPNNAVAIFTDADGLSPAHTTWEWKIQNFYPYPEPDFVPRYEDGAFWRVSAVDTPIDRI